MKIRITALIFSVAMLAILLSGCGCEHEWAEATCLTPKTCNLCQETEGEGLGHNWAEVTCAAPKTCTACGETEGEALPHTWVEANYQTPKTCDVCGATEGEPLPADFEVHGLLCTLKSSSRANEVYYPYVTKCYNDPTKMTTGDLWLHYRVFESDASHAAKEGYEWRAVYFEILFNDENANKYGWTWHVCVDNYYDTESFSDSEKEIVDGTTAEFTVNYHGEEYVVTASFENVESGEWKDGRITISGNCYVQVPVGYDGIVLGFLDVGDTDYAEDVYIYDIANENSLFFRMK